MAERTRRAETVRAARPLRIGDVILLAIERVAVRSGRSGPGVWATADLDPHAIVVRDAAGVRAVALDGTPLPLGPLRETIPGLDDLLAPVERRADPTSPAP